MSKVSITRSLLDDLAMSISAKSGEAVPMTLTEMKDAVDGIQTGGGTPRTSTDLTVSGATVTAPAGVYATDASKSVASGTAGTPTATKGTVSNHSISVTPSVTNTSGYITGSTKTGTAVTVSASELVSGSDTVTSNDTYDVTNLAELVVNVSGGGSVTQDQDGYIVLPSTGGGGGGATQHVIHFEFTDSTDTDINVYYDDSLISTMITAYTPETYGQKTVDTASLDGVAWYTRPTETWETVLNGNLHVNAGNPYGDIWAGDLGSVSIALGSVWRITIDNGTPYTVTATANGIYGSPNQNIIGNPLFLGGTDDGSDVPFAFEQNPWGAWTGGTDTSITQDADHHFKIERQISA